MGIFKSHILRQLYPLKGALESRLFSFFFFLSFKKVCCVRSWTLILTNNFFFGTVVCFFLPLTCSISKTIRVWSWRHGLCGFLSVLRELLHSGWRTPSWRWQGMRSPPTEMGNLTKPERLPRARYIVTLPPSLRGLSVDLNPGHPKESPGELGNDAIVKAAP